MLPSYKERISTSDRAILYNLSSSKAPSHLFISFLAPICSSELDDFIQQLSFVQQENQTLSSKITLFIDQYQILLEVVKKQVYATLIGYTGKELGIFSYSAKNEVMSSRLLLEQTTQMLINCDLWLQQVHSSAPLSLLFWVEDLQKIYDTILDFIATNCKKSFDLLLPRISMLIPSKILRKIYIGIPGVTSDCITQYRETFIAKDHCWLKVVSDFLQAWHSQLKEPRCLKPAQSLRATDMQLHSFECSNDKKPLMVLCVMRHIYKVRQNNFTILYL